MYIEPNTEIRLLRNCPLDSNYEHTIYFNTVEEQTQYFFGLTRHLLTGNTYQRVHKGKMRVAHRAEDLYSCNYLMFKNTAFTDKWFYAFIKSIEYVNNVTSEIEYEIDVIQTWFFESELAMCFVEREHSETDNIGDNLVPEPLETGEYVADDFDAVEDLERTAIVVAATFDANYEDIGGKTYSGVFSGLCYTAFQNDEAGRQTCAEFIAGAGSKSDGIVSVFLMPSKMITAENGSAKSYRFSKSKNIFSVGGYAPVRNKKLFTYPYNFLYVTNLQGNHAVFRYEFFSDSSCNFRVAGDMSCNPQVVLFPENYKGVPENYDEKLVLSGFPQLSFNTDTFKAWIAQNGASLAVHTLGTSLGSGVSMIGSAATGNAIGTIRNGLSFATSIAGALATVYEHSIMPNQAHGSTGATTMAALGLLNFAFMHKHITPEFAAIIDDYFDKYGYATHRVKIPNRNVRPHWTYTKTIGCEVNGLVPSDDVRKICNIYDKGITFWTKGENVGKYNLDNSV